MPRLRIGVVLFNLGSTQGMTETTETREAESLSKKGMPRLVQGSLTLVATRKELQRWQMPPPCAVEFHASCFSHNQLVSRLAR